MKVVLAVMVMATLAQPEDIATLFHAARAAERQRDFAAAAKLYDSIIAMDPRIAEVWANKGLVLHELGRHRESLAAFTRAAALKPELFTPHLFLGIEHLRFGEPEKAAASLRKAVAIDPAHPQAVYRLGLAYLEWSRVSAQKLVKTGSPYGLILVGELEALRGFAEAAEADFEAAAKALPGSFELQRARNRPAAAAADAFAAPIAMWARGEYEKALEAFRDLPGDRAVYWVSLTCRALARETLLRAIEQAPDSAPAHLLFADLARDSGDDDGALGHYRKAAALAASDAGVRLIYVQYLNSKRPGPDATAQTQAAVRDFPAHAGLNYELGRLLLKAGDIAGAAGCFRRTLAGEPGHTAARAGLADAYAALGEVSKAIAEMERAASKDPDGSLHYKLARWYQQTGNAEQARAAFAETSRLKRKKFEEDRARLAGTMLEAR